MWLGLYFVVLVNKYMLAAALGMLLAGESFGEILEQEQPEDFNDRDRDRIGGRDDEETRLDATLLLEIERRRLLEIEQRRLIPAIFEGDVDSVQRILANPRIDVNRRDGHGWTALGVAALSRNVHILRLLLAQPNIDVNGFMQMPLTQGTPLLIAVLNNDVESVRLLLEQTRTDVNSADERGLLPLFWAVEEGQVEIVRALLNHSGLDINRRFQGRPILIWALSTWIRNNIDTEIIRLLLDHKDIDVNAEFQGISARSFALMYGNDEIKEAFHQYNLRTGNQPS